MTRVYFGHCIGCDQPIRPPYLSFKVMQNINDGNTVREWEEVDVCGECADQMNANDLHRFVSADEAKEADQ